MTGMFALIKYLVYSEKFGGEVGGILTGRAPKLISFNSVVVN